MGRKPLFDAPMSPTQRAKRSRAKQRAERLAATEQWWREHSPFGQLVDIRDMLPKGAVTLDELLLRQQREGRGHGRLEAG
ncbi:hypothetical protein RB623_10950 [Mesorhizobium sp. LHD-90]|uniref:hypothetical protein n=1 Tax=Mesorhizobium sp. LHD-90 TaxID=3071414 RepID=UPI0027E17EFF|nr:hypothetical protein [Mesorhizobium sp. LHD-90]MDQ6434564.1 hypothetical protein [Mesorhizobium sp. LHD-90]